MIMKYYIVDAFAEEIFKGNQAGVCLLEKPLDEETMQNIAIENNLAETAFVLKNEQAYDLRWFTPEYEIDLCGHATLATAFIIMNFVDKSAETLHFNTKSGLLTVVKNGDLFEMNFPARAPRQIEITSAMENAIGVRVLEAHLSRDLVLLVESEETVKELQPNFEIMMTIPDCLGVVVTAKGKSADFVSRYFAPDVGIPEDAVTGSSHAKLIPFWTTRLNKTKMVARQVSRRGGTLFCENNGDRVIVSGKASLYLEGYIHIA